MSRPLQRSRLVDAENGWCLRANRVCACIGVLRYFAAVSRLGDGAFWYALMGTLVVVDGMARIFFPGMPVAPTEAGTAPAEAAAAAAPPAAAMAHYPALAWLLVPFTASVAASRVVLGLHYPSDVLAATAIGSALAALALWLVPGVSLFA